jgi:hypothetical protein
MTVQGYWLAERPQAYSKQQQTLGERVLAVDPRQWVSGAQTEELLSGRVALLTEERNSSAQVDMGSRIRHELYGLKDSLLRPFCRKTHRPFPMADKENRLGGKNWRFVSSALVDGGHFSTTPPSEALRPQTADKSLVDAVQALLQHEPTLLVVFSSGGGHAAEVFAGHSRVRPKMIIPHVMFSSRMNFADDAPKMEGRSTLRMVDDHQIGLLGGKALLQMGAQRELNAENDYAQARTKGASVVEYLPLLGVWRNAMNGREVSPLEHMLDHLDQMTHLGWNKQGVGMHVSIDLNVFADGMGFSAADSRPMGCSLQELGSVLTWVGRTGVCRVLHLQGEFDGLDSRRLAGVTQFVSSLVYKLVLLREEYSER